MPIDGIAGDGAVIFLDPDKRMIVYKRKTRKSCCSCAVYLAKGNSCLAIKRFKFLFDGNSYGDDHQLMDWFMCAECGKICLDLMEEHFNINIEKTMTENRTNYLENKL